MVVKSKMMNKNWCKILLFVVLSLKISSVFADVKTEKAILLVTFGTSYPEARLAFNHIEDMVRAEFPDTEVRWAYTSKIIRKILKKRGEYVYSPAEALAKLGEDGYTHVAVQSLHVIPGEEYENLQITVNAFNGMPKGIQKVQLGRPLLYDNEDHMKLADFIDLEYKDKIGKNEALVLMGHGTHHAANIYYPGFQYYLNQKSDKYLVGTVEGFPTLEQVIPQLKKSGVKLVTLAPFMSVAGDHARNDMAGDEEDSWKRIFEKEGFEVQTVLKGMAEYSQVVNIWLDHLKGVMGGISHQDE